MESLPSEVKIVVSHGDNPQVDQSNEQDSDDVEISNQSSDILFDDSGSKSSSTNNNNIKVEHVENAPKIVKTPDSTEEDIADSLYS